MVNLDSFLLNSESFWTFLEQNFDYNWTLDWTGFVLSLNLTSPVINSPGVKRALGCQKVPSSYE